MLPALVLATMLCAAPGTDPAPPAPARSDAGALELTPPKLDVGELAAPAPDTHELRLRKWERALKWSTAASLLVTSTLGTMAAINQPTAFGDGRCITGNAVLGTYGCDRGLSTLHGASGVLSVTLYTANAALALSLREPVGNVSPGERPWHTGLTYVHLGGIVVQPILGLIAAYPQVIGMRSTIPTDSFPRDMRTAHLFIGYITTAAYIATLVLEQ